MESCPSRGTVDDDVLALPLGRGILRGSRAATAVHGVETRGPRRTVLMSPARPFADKSCSDIFGGGQGTDRLQVNTRNQSSPTYQNQQPHPRKRIKATGHEGLMLTPSFRPCKCTTMLPDYWLHYDATPLFLLAIPYMQPPKSFVITELWLRNSHR